MYSFYNFQPKKNTGGKYNPNQVGKGGKGGGIGGKGSRKGASNSGKGKWGSKASDEPGAGNPAPILTLPGKITEPSKEVFDTPPPAANPT